MIRATGKGTPQSHKKVLERAKGFRGRNSTCHRIAIEKVEKALAYSYRDRKQKKRSFRSLWIQKISAACSEYNIAYNAFISNLNKQNVLVNRKILAQLSYLEPLTFKSLVYGV